jgi:trehalose/maltose transport system permease protein
VTARRLAGRIGLAVAALAIAVWSLFPLAWALLTSLRPGDQLFEGAIFPERIAWDNYAAVFAEQPFLRNIVNSLLVAGATVAIAIALASLAAFALGRLRFRGREALLLAFLGVSVFPQIAILSGLFALVRDAGLYDSLASLVIAYMIFTLPFCVWMITTAMAEIPRALEEAAYVDGATPFWVLLRIFLPLIAPTVAATGLLAFITAWNEFLFALTFTLSPDTRTVPVAIALISGASQYELPWGRIMAASVIVTLPMIAIALLFQRRIVSGLTAGAVRG